MQEKIQRRGYNSGSGLATGKRYFPTYCPYGVRPCHREEISSCTLAYI